MDWGFYGRNQELNQLRDILSRNRWFFARLTGRRRIGKTTLVQRALQVTPTRPVFYVQIPDSAPAGVLSAVHDAMDTFGLDPHRFRWAGDLAGSEQLRIDLATARRPDLVCDVVRCPPEGIPGQVVGLQVQKHRHYHEIEIVHDII